MTSKNKKTEVNNKNKFVDGEADIILANLFPVILTRCVDMENITTEKREPKKKHYTKYLKL